MDRTAAEFSTLSDASCHGFTLAGSGSAFVTTPPCYVPGNSYEVTATGSQVGSSSTTIAAQANGTLMIPVALGPANPYQEYTALAAVAGAQVYTTGVTIAPAN